ncbi:MAG: T9SS type A sorting domain-containing protein [Bacteroidales bacterium]|nr:T9SS type A sorting domain-containing protein [Bacteroidales bacterium]
MKTKIFFGIIIFIAAGIVLASLFHGSTSEDFIGNRNDNNKYSKLSSSAIAYYHAGWEFLKTRDPGTNEIPPDIKAKELKYVSGIPAKTDYLRMSDRQTAPEQYRDQAWESMGPDNVCGRILAVELDIENEEIILAGSASGGLWRSTDAGVSWVKTTALNAVQSVTCIEQDIRDGKTNTWYYGTGELTSTTDRQFSIFPRTVGFGNGIYKSTDNGSTWALLQSTSGGITGELTGAFQGIWNIAADPGNLENDVLYVAGYGGILRSDDGGNTWLHVLGDVIIKSFCTDVIISPDGIIYAALGTFSTNESGIMPTVFGIWKSEDGLNWTSITPDGFPSNYRTIKLEIPETNPNSLYVLTENPIPDPDATFSFTASEHKLWKGSHLNTGEPEWVDRTDNIPGKGLGNILVGFYDPPHGYNSIAGYAMMLKAHPENEDILFLGGTNLYRNTTGFTDSTFTRLLGGYPYDGTHDNLHPDLHAVKVLPSNPDIMFAACDGGLFKTMNCLADSVVWEYISDGLVNTQFYWVGIDHAGVEDDFVIGGCQDNAIYYHDSYFPSSEWETIIGGDGLTCMVSDDKTYAVISVYNGSIFSLTFDDDMNIENEIYQTPDMVDNGDFIFYTHFIIDRAGNKIFYMAAKNRILRKDDMEAAAYDTSLVNTGWNWLDNTGLNGDEFITAINTSEEPPNILYYGSHNGRVFRMDNAHTGNPEATELTSDLFPENGFIGYIEIDEYDADNIFVVFSNYNVQSIFHSPDGGETWTHESGNLEEHPHGAGGGPSVRCLKMVHYDDGVAYFAATSAGLFSTYELNGNQTVWVQEGESVIGNIIVDNIDTRETDGWIVVATQGSGVFSTIFEPSGIEPPISPERIVLKQNYPNPCFEETTIAFTISKACNIQLKLFDINGKEIANLAEGYFEYGEHKVHLNTSSIPTGSYFYRLEAGKSVSTKRLIVLR